MVLKSIFSIRRIISRISNPFVRLKLYLKGRLGWLGTPLVVPFNGYSNAHRVFISGRVTEDKGLEKPKSSQSMWENLLSMVKRYSSDTIPEQEVEIVFGRQIKWVKANEYGLFYATFEVTDELSDHYWARFKQTDVKPHDWQKAPVFDYSNGFDMGLISDIDDTILISHSTKFFRKLRLMLFRNATTRKSVPGMAEFYHRFVSGHSHFANRPVFYVSSSEWNLYDLLDDFLQLMDFPRGILKLRENEINPLRFWKSGKGNHELKGEKINLILKQFPASRFILCGDSGQRDLEIYYQIAIDNPGRIVVVYIREVRGIRHSLKKIHYWKNRYGESNIPLVLVKEAREMIESAMDKKIIVANKGSDIFKRKH